MEQQLKLMLGINELKNTYKQLKNLDFSENILNELGDMIDDLMGLVEIREIKAGLLRDIGYNYETKKYYIKESK